VSYLNFIREFWFSIVDGVPEALMRIDQRTVEKLQLHAPGVSQEDSKIVQGLVLSGQIFSGFSAPEREAIWGKLQSFDRLVPSLYTFFEDLKYFTACADCIQRLLVTNKNHPTLYTTMGHMFRPTDSDGEEYLIQVSESRFRRVTGTWDERLDLGYRVLWLFAMRHYPQMAKDSRRDVLLAKAPSEKADEAVIYEMAALARKLGFRSAQITRLLSRSPDRQIAHAALLKARKPERYRYDPERLERLIDRISACFSEAVAGEMATVHELIADPVLPSSSRCGLPQRRVHQQDLPFLFLDRLDVNAGWGGEQISTLFVRRCVYLAFFGASPNRLGQCQEFIPEAASPLFNAIDHHIDEQGPEAAVLEKLRRDAVERAAEIERLHKNAEVTATEQQRLARELEFAQEATRMGAVERERLQEVAESMSKKQAATIEQLQAQLKEQAAAYERLKDIADRQEQQQEDSQSAATAGQERIREMERRLQEETIRATKQHNLWQHAEAGVSKRDLEIKNLKDQLEGQKTAYTLLQQEQAAELDELRRELAEKALENGQIKVEAEQRVAALNIELQQFRSEAEKRSTEHVRIQEADTVRMELSAEIQVLREQHAAECKRLREAVTEYETENKRLQMVVEKASGYVYDGLVPPSILHNNVPGPGKPVTITLMLFEENSWKRLRTMKLLTSDLGDLQRFLYQQKTKYLRDNPSRVLQFYNMDFRSMPIGVCLRAATEDCTVLMSVEDLSNANEQHTAVRQMLGITHRNPEAEELSADIGQSMVTPNNRTEGPSTVTPDAVETEADTPERKKIRQKKVS
jgi:hypothetical protein